MTGATNNSTEAHAAWVYLLQHPHLQWLPPKACLS